MEYQELFTNWNSKGHVQRKIRAFRIVKAVQMILYSRQNQLSLERRLHFDASISQH